MANPKSKGLTYFLVFIGLVLAGALTLVAILMLSPGKSIGGYTWISENINSRSLLDDVDTTSFDDVVIESQFYHVVVTERDEISPDKPFNIFLSSTLTGVAKFEAYETAVDVSIDEQNDVHFSFTKIPVGLLFGKAGCVINVVTYTDHALWHSKTITIKTTSGNVVLGGPTNGALIAQDLLLNSVSVETETGNITASTKFSVGATGTVNLKSVSGSIWLNNSLTAATTTIENTSGNVFFAEEKTLTSALVTLGDIAEFSFQNVVGNVTMNNTSGMFTAKKITGNVHCEDTMAMTDITIEEITGTFHAESATSANITILKIAGNVNINGESGAVSITEPLSYTVIETTSGDVTLTDVNCELEIITTSGNVTIDYKDALATCAQANITTEKGTVTVHKAVGIVNVTATGSGSVNITFVKTVGVSILSTNTGSINAQISVAAQNLFNLTTDSGESVSIDLGSYISLVKELTTHAINGYTGSGNDIVLHSTNGAIAVSTLL